MTGYANRHSGEVESLVPVGSSPTSVTDTEHDPVVQRRRRLGDNQESAGSIPAGITDSAEEGSVGVLAAHLRGKEEDPVQLRARTSRRCGPLVQREDAWFAPRQSGFDSPAVHCKTYGLMVQWDDTALAWRRSEFNSRSVH